MAEPSSTTASGIAIATGVVGLTGSIVGLQFDALLFGLFGGLISLMHMPPESGLKMAGTLATAALLGAVCSQFAPLIVHNLGSMHAALAWTKSIPADPVRLGASLAVGIVAQVAIPWALAFIVSRTPKRVQP